MLSSPRARFAYVLIMLAAFAGVSGLAVIVLKQTVSAGVAEAWMMAVVVALPLALILLSVASWLAGQVRHHGIIPNAGENVPGAGQ